MLTRLTMDRHQRCPSFAGPAAILIIACALLEAPQGAVHAQSDYPSRPVRIILDSAAGSANDATGRVLADKLGRLWGQQVLTVNQPGAGGAISARAAAASPADGYTLYLPATSPFLALPGVSGTAPNLPIELPRDFASIGFVLQQPLFIGASHASGITSIAQLIALAKEKPGEISYAATGRGRLTHLTMELLQARAGVKLQLVPYAGGTAQALNDVVSGRIPLVLDAYAGLAAAIQGEVEIIQCGTIEKAVDSAYSRARPGDVVLLAPACASFDQFDNYEHRGRVFKQAVAALSEKQAAK